MKEAADCPLCGKKVYAVAKGQLVPNCYCMYGDSWKDGKLYWEDQGLKIKMTDWWNNLIEESKKSDHIIQIKGGVK